ncbi:MAG: Fic family protein, partial [Deltaproteobacteria bacterium]|nr:Fic family protein [Deltaproteobacteria bacterium]
MAQNGIPYTRPSQMEPMLPPDSRGELRDLAIEVIRRSAALGASVHRETAKGVAELMRSTNSCYSNLIEDHNTHPVDMEKALAKDYSKDPARRAFQMKSAAHVEVQRLTERLIEREPETDICSREFLCLIHKQFYNHLPEEFKEIKAPDGAARIVKPGNLRGDEEEVERPPAASSLALFLDHFSEAYNPNGLDSVNKVIAAAASHHRLVWIHPFLEGNGRVARIFTHTYLIKAGIDGHGMWAVSRGLARHREDYLAALAEADEQRRGGLGGRGNLSEQGLVLFCRFFLKTTLDQIDFMRNLLDLDGMQKRIGAYAQQQALMDELP